MKIVGKILIYIMLLVGIFILFRAAQGLLEKMETDSIRENGTLMQGLVISIDTEEEEIVLMVNKETIVKRLSTSEIARFRNGDEVQGFYYSKYPEKFIFEYEYIEYYQLLIFFGLFVLCTLPYIAIIHNRPRDKDYTNRLISNK